MPHPADRFLRTSLATLALTLGAAQAHAVVEAGHWQVRSISGSSSNLSVTVDQTVGGDFTGVLMNYASGVLTGLSFNADEGMDIFVVKPGQTLSNATLGSGQMPFIGGPSAANGAFTISTPNVGRDFYLGVRTRSFSDPGFQDAVDAGQLGSFFTSFGWAHVQVDAFGFASVAGSAMAFREGGIVVGTLQPVPEPSTLALGGLGFIALLLGVRRAKAIAPR